MPLEKKRRIFLRTNTGIDTKGTKANHLCSPMKSKLKREEMKIKQ